MVKSSLPSTQPLAHNSLKGSLKALMTIPVLTDCKEEVRLTAAAGSSSSPSSIRNGLRVEPGYESNNIFNLNSVRHDHPLLSSSISSPPLGSSFEHSIFSSSNQQPLPSLTQMDWRTDFEAKHSCLPYGYYFDTDAMTTEAEDRLLSKSPEVDPDDEWMLLEDSLNSNLTSFPSFSRVTTKDSGPTLAQLNLTDVWDGDDLIAVPIAGSDRSLKRQLSEKSHESSRRIIIKSEPTEHKESQVLSGNPIKMENVEHPVPCHSPRKVVIVSSSKNDLPSLHQKNKALVAIHIKQEDKQEQEVVQESQPSFIISNESKPSVSPLMERKQVTIKTEPRDEGASVSKPSKGVPKGLSRVRNTSEGSVSSHDEGFASQQEESDDEDVDSDDESFYGDYEAKDLLGASTCDDKDNKWALNMGRTRKGGQQRFFWQYNVQSKGPKGIRIPAVSESAADPHVLSEASDPVFSPECRIEGVKHAGKARRGDGNDLTPNPRKLLMIGLELKKLSKTINDLTPVTDVPMTARNKTRKEKNKLASRACRLKKKAQHEANKIKLFGLNQEHKKTMALMAVIKKVVKKRLEARNSSSPLTPSIQETLQTHQSQITVAGMTAEFVNSILDKVAEGVADGGLSSM